mgnify:FL=1
MEAMADLDDLRSFARLGLLQAVRQWRPGRGVKFWTYARHRVMGAVRDGLRTANWYSRTAARNGHSRHAIVSIEGLCEVGARGEPSTLPSLEDVDRRDTLDWLAMPFSRVERAIWDGLRSGQRMCDIGRMVGLSESRVSQVRRRLLDRCRRRLGLVR